MIQFFATRSHHHLVRNFIDWWSPESSAGIRSVPYEDFPVWRTFPGGVCIFTDFERLRPEELALAGKLSEALRARPENYMVFNEPRHYAGRYNLQKLLHERGINDFRVRRIDEPIDDLNYPVFLRNELDHDGPISPLLHSRDELNRALAQPVLQNPGMRKHLMLVEYCDCAQDGLFRKYSVMNVAGTLIPRHVLFSHNWSTKTPDLVTDQSVEEEADFMENFPHAQPVREIFRLAGLDYGRIDYGLRAGRIQVWEINTNPTIVPRPRKINPRRMAGQTASAQRIVEALRVLSDRHPGAGAHPFRTRSFFAIKALQLSRQLRNSHWR